MVSCCPQESDCYPHLGDVINEAEPDDELWLMDYPSPREDVASTPSEKLPLTPAQATEALEKFRPIRACPADLEHLLQCRADPNMPVKEGNISPVRNVIAFARSEAHVEKMGQLRWTTGRMNRTRTIPA